MRKLNPASQWAQINHSSSPSAWEGEAYWCQGQNNALLFLRTRRGDRRQGQTNVPLFLPTRRGDRRRGQTIAHLLSSNSAREPTSGSDERLITRLEHTFLRTEESSSRRFSQDESRRMPKKGASCAPRPLGGGRISSCVDPLGMGSRRSFLQGSHTCSNFLYFV